jgi:alpha-beta hydrolase superfamily lysophospholipase
MYPLFFGDQERQLYGVYHMPDPAVARPLGAVLCAPVFHEAVDARRALRALGEQLATAGIHALRFDYQGTGDSAGDGDQCRVADWIQDIGTARDELASSRGLETVGLIGLRFGSTLAMQLAARSGDVPFAVLWEPIVDGGPYMQGLRQLQRDWVAYESEQRPTARAHATQGEIFGHPLSVDLADGLASQDLTHGDAPAPADVLLVDEGSCAGLDGLERHLSGKGVRVTHQRIDGGQIWRREFDGASAQVPRELVSQVVDWVSERPGR